MEKDSITRENTSSESSCDIYITGTESTFEDNFLDRSTTTETENQLTRAFVAIWDPVHDVLFLTHPNSDRGSFPTTKPDLYPSESISDLHSLGGDMSLRSSLCHHFQETSDEAEEPLYGTFTCEQRSLKGITQTSSTLGGLDVYLKGQALSYTHPHQPVYSVLDFNTDFHFDPRCVGLDPNSRDASIFRGSWLLNTNLSQDACGVGEEQFSASWSTVESPTEEEIESMKKPSETVKPRAGRRLKKRRPDHTFLSSAKASPAIGSNGSVEPQGCCYSLSRNKGILKGLLNFRNLKRRAEQGWIWVEP